MISKLSQIPALLNALWQLRSCTSLGSKPRVYGKAKILNLGTLDIGERFLYFSHTATSEMVAYKGAELIIGNRVFINYGTSISAHLKVKIGDHCQIGSHVTILDCDYHCVEDRNLPAVPKAVILSNNVWVGIRAIILPGVSIGENSVIGAGSVVTKDIPSNCLAAGVPAKIIRHFEPKNQR
jgi:acetyltransferase-like isoleucine patch superfamily enzyme